MSYRDDWFRRFGRRVDIFGNLDRFIEEMEKEMAESFKNMEEEMPENLFRERRLPDGSIRKEYGPFVYGYSVRIGPDGKPVIREFGNMRPRLEGKNVSPFNLQDKREPLVDVIEEDDSIRVMAELPGVDKADIQLFATSESLTISVDKPQKKYYKELKMPVEIEDSSAKSTYVNGVLEVAFNKKMNVKKGTRIDIK